MTVKSLELSPTVKETVRMAKGFSASERLFLAKELLDSLLVDETLDLATDEEMQELPLLSLDPQPAAHEEEWSTSAELVRQIQSMTVDPDAFHSATKSIESWLAEQAVNPPTPSALSPSEWEQLWSEFERELKAFERANIIAEGWNERHG